MSQGLRERKKQEQRQAISDAATLLFVERGFEQVTIAHIADVVGVAKMTVTNYFPRKEDLVFDQHELLTRRLARTAAGRLPGETALDALRRDYAEAVAARDELLGVTSRGFAQLVESSPVLLARLREILEQQERALADQLATEAPDQPLAAQLVAAQLAAVHRILWSEAHRRTLAGVAPERIFRLLGEAAEDAYAGLARLYQGDDRVLKRRPASE